MGVVLVGEVVDGVEFCTFITVGTGVGGAT